MRVWRARENYWKSIAKMKGAKNMDLKEVVETVAEQADEAKRAFHAGHHDNAEAHLGELRLVIEAYWMETRKPGEVLGESATSEKPAETIEETQAQVSGPGVHPAVIDPAAAAQQVGGSLTDEKPSQ